MNVKITWRGNAAFLGEAASGHQVLMDGLLKEVAPITGPRPMEMLLLGMGACSSYDVVSILRKSRQTLTACEVEITAERAANEPKVFTSIHLHFYLTGLNLHEQRVRRAIELSAEKYCSASIMLGATAKITHDFEIKQD